jgi:hypothetical protein
MKRDGTHLLKSHRARRASSSRSPGNPQPDPTPRPSAAFPGTENYVWKGSAETETPHRVAIRLDVYWLPEADRYLYVVEFPNRHG